MTHRAAALPLVILAGCADSGTIESPSPMTTPAEAVDALISPRVFQPSWYAALNPDLATAFGDHLSRAESHWLHVGVAEGRRSLPGFEVSAYLDAYPDLVAAFGGRDHAQAACHWVARGLAEGRVASPAFDAAWYLSRYPDLRQALGPTNYAAAFDHWHSVGIGEGRQGSPQFDPVQYMRANPDVAAAYGATNWAGAVTHWLTVGRSEGRPIAVAPTPAFIPLPPPMPPSGNPGGNGNPGGSGNPGGNGSPGGNGNPGGGGDPGGNGGPPPDLVCSSRPGAALDPGGNVDSTQRLQECIDVAPLGGVTIIPGGRYRLDGPVALRGGRTLRATPGTTLFATDHAAGLRFTDLPNLTHLDNVTMDYGPAGNGRVPIADYVVPKREVQAFHGFFGQGGGPYNEFHVTNYRHQRPGGPIQIYQIFFNDPSTFVNKEWNARGHFERMDTLQWYSFSDGRALPADPRFDIGYPDGTSMQQYFPNSCRPHGNPTDYSWYRRIVAHFVEDLGGDLGLQDLIRVRYHHMGDDCPWVDENMDYSSELGQVRWFAQCDGVTHGIRQAQTLADDVTLPDLRYDCR
jgi:hypothetical protein